MRVLQFLVGAVDAYDEAVLTLLVAFRYSIDLFNSCIFLVLGFLAVAEDGDVCNSADVAVRVSSTLGGDWG